jgi:hypothetical protein
MVADPELKAGSYVGWKEGERRRYGLLLSVDPSGAIWALRLHHPYRRCRRSLDDTTVLAGPAETLAGLDQLAVDFARKTRCSTT